MNENVFLAEDFLGFCMESFGERKRETGFYGGGFKFRVRGGR